MIDHAGRIKVPAWHVDEVVDLTGSGDLFAAGFLFGHARGWPRDASARLGTLCAANIIGHFGPRPQTSLKDLARQNGFHI